MNPEKRASAERLANDTVGLPEAQRAAYLDANCTDQELRAEVEKLLELHPERRSPESRRPPSDSLATIGIPDGAVPESTEDNAGSPKDSTGSTVSPGTLVANRYKVIKLVGHGGMGAVYLAEDFQLERNVALKFLAPELATDSEQRRRFLKEARSASALNHPNVCVVYEVGETDDRPYIAMEFVEGSDLATHIRAGGMGIPIYIRTCPCRVVSWPTRARVLAHATQTTVLVV